MAKGTNRPNLPLNRERNAQQPAAAQTGATPPSSVAERHSTQSCSNTRSSSNFTGLAR